ncbi:MAG: hypothetical protein ACFFD5_13870, partial [Candidatus Thorarchaeota archaeon]
KEIVTSTGEFDLISKDFQYNEKARNMYPKTLIFELSNQNKIVLEVAKIIDADQLLSDFNPVLRFLAKNILKINPGYFRFNSKFEIQMTQNGESYKEKGNTLHEMVIVRETS